LMVRIGRGASNIPVGPLAGASTTRIACRGDRLNGSVRPAMGASAAHANSPAWAQRGPLVRAMVRAGLR
jgi:hypothetical protein